MMKMPMESPLVMIIKLLTIAVLSVTLFKDVRGIREKRCVKPQDSGPTHGL